MKSSALSVKGTDHTENEDAYLCRDESGLWAVADGVGGSGPGAIASRYLMATLAGLSLIDQMDEDFHTCLDGLQKANTDLRQMDGSVPVASTLCGLLHSEGKSIVFWVGDSRAYRIAKGELVQLTQDHGGPAFGVAKHVITRAFGATDHVTVDRRLIESTGGDLVLLCTDGFYPILEQAGLKTIAALDNGGLADVARCLQLLCDDHEFTDDATWVLIDCA